MVESCCFITPITGGQGGKPYYYLPGVPVKAISTWATGFAIRKIELVFADDTKVSAGDCSSGDKFEQFVFAPREYVVKCSMWGNGAGTRHGAFRLETNQGRVFFPKMTSWGLKTEYNYDHAVGSGYLMGMTGRAGSDIDCNGFYFLRPVNTSRLVNVQWNITPDQLGWYDDALAKDSIDVDNTKNTVDDENEYTFSFEVSTEREFTVKTSAEISSEITVGCEVPAVAKVETKLGVKFTNEVGSALREAKTMTRQFKKTIKVPAGQRHRYSVVVTRKTINTSWEGKVEVTTDNGAKLTWPAKGKFKSENSMDWTLQNVNVTE